jgi:hypothetical protein
MIPIESFEKQLVTLATKPGILHEFTNWCTVPIWARIIVVIELFIGFSLLIPFIQRRLTIPLAISMLLVFILHLAYQITLFGNTGNCGCMGELIPMSPLSAILKNIMCIIALIYLIKVSPVLKNENSAYHILLLTGITIIVFLFWPIKKTCCCEDEFTRMLNNEVQVLNDRLDSLETLLHSNNVKGIVTMDSLPEKGEKKVVSHISEFHNYTDFEFNGKKIKSQIDEDKSIVCVFNPDCDHCLEMAKKLKTIKKSSTAKIQFLFFNPDALDENEMRSQISMFLSKSGITVPFKIIDASSFNKLLVNSISGPPRLTFLENGKIVYDCPAEKTLDIMKLRTLSKIKSN